jgi:transcription elongation GreA/GreB family factor
MRILRHSSEKLKIRDTSPVHLTQDGFDRLKNQLERLKKSLPELINETQRTAAYGDRSENAEYKEAKGLLRRTHRQIIGISDKIKRAVIIASGPNASGGVRIGSSVILETKGKKLTFEILGSSETDPAHGRISFQSPLGAALIDRRVGDTVAIKTPGGDQEYRILEIR